MSDDSDALDRLEEELDLPRALVLEETADGDISIDCPFTQLDENDCIALLVKALMVELGPTLVGVLEGVELDDEDGDA